MSLEVGVDGVAQADERGRSESSGDLRGSRESRLKPAGADFPLALDPAVQRDSPSCLLRCLVRGGC